MKAKWVGALLLAVAGIAIYAGTILATPPTTPGFSGTTLAKATFGELDIKAHVIPADLWKAELKTKGDSDLYVQQNTWDPSLCETVARARGVVGFGSTVRSTATAEALS